MPRFFIDASQVYTDGDACLIRITGEDAHHITHVLRTRIGEEIIACDEAGMVYRTVLTEAGEGVLLRVLEQSAADTEPPYIATVYQALVKGDKMETVIQKAVETGASVIVPMVTSRAVVKLDEKDAGKKTERWQKIAHEAAKQCGRGIIPRVTLPVSFKEAMQQAASADLALFCYEGGGTESLTTLCRKTEAPKTISLCVGPEGGFADGEAEAAAEAGLRMCGLGKRILRTETAALFVLSCLSAIYEL
ncbi:MAG: 16S rRNA (uracil(1498)-N(3))-methyltransferase [Ruminococcaceae bacterium]|nr:16S rRNA (uracil(1498)-N(3))-methyltransferase [Oscillospiraceae bacterium]